MGFKTRKKFFDETGKNVAKVAAKAADFYDDVKEGATKFFDDLVKLTKADFQKAAKRFLNSNNALKVARQHKQAAINKAKNAINHAKKKQEMQLDTLVIPLEER